MQAGCFLGCLIAIWVGDKWGRRIALLVAAFVSMIGCVLQAAAEGYLSVLYIGRCVPSTTLSPLCVAITCLL